MAHVVKTGFNQGYKQPSATVYIFQSRPGGLHLMVDESDVKSFATQVGGT